MRALELKIPPVAQWFIAAIAMGLIAWLMPAADFDFPGQLLVASLLLLVAGMVGGAGVRAFAHAGTTVNPLCPERAASLVTHGIYRHTRNPMYLALALALCAWGIWLGSGPALLVVPLFVVALDRLQIRPEERVLEIAFGDAFLAYRQRVRRWI